MKGRHRGSHFDHLLFPEHRPSDAKESGPQASPTQRRGFLLQRYYGYYRRAIRDALTRPSRKPFCCGGLQGYDQLRGLYQHLVAREQADPYLDELERRVQAALEATESQAEDVRQARTFLTEVEHYLAQVPRPQWKPDSEESNPPPGSEAVRKTLAKMFSDWGAREEAGSTIRRLLSKWDTMSKT